MREPSSCLPCPLELSQQSLSTFLISDVESCQALTNGTRFSCAVIHTCVVCDIKPTILMTSVPSLSLSVSSLLRKCNFELFTCTFQIGPAGHFCSSGLQQWSLGEGDAKGIRGSGNKPLVTTAGTLNSPATNQLT